MWSSFRKEHKGAGFSVQELAQMYKQKYSNTSNKKPSTKKPSSKKSSETATNEFKEKTLSELFTPANKEAREYGDHWTITTNSPPRKDVVFTRSRYKSGGFTVTYNDLDANFGGITNYSNWQRSLAKFVNLKVPPLLTNKVKISHEFYEVNKNGEPTPEAIEKFKQDCKADFKDNPERE